MKAFPRKKKAENVDMSAEQIRQFRNGLAEFVCGAVPWTTHTKNFEDRVYDLPYAFGFEFKQAIHRGFREFITKAISDCIQHGRVIAGNFDGWLQEISAEVLPDHPDFTTPSGARDTLTESNNAIQLWNTHFVPLIDMYNSAIDCIVEYNNTVWITNKGNNDPNIVQHEYPEEHPFVVNHPVPRTGGRRRSRRTRRSRRSTSKRHRR